MSEQFNGYSRVGTHAPVAVPRIRTMVTAKEKNDAHDRNRTSNTFCPVRIFHGEL
jgi:hypothetical protein